MILMPSKLGSAMIRRLRMYFPIVVPPSPVQVLRIGNLNSDFTFPDTSS